MCAIRISNEGHSSSASNDSQWVLNVSHTTVPWYATQAVKKSFWGHRGSNSATKSLKGTTVRMCVISIPSSHFEPSCVIYGRLNVKKLNVFRGSSRRSPWGFRTGVS